MLVINTASHLLKLCVAANCSSGVTGTRSEQLAETLTFVGYYAQYKYSQPFAETVCGSKLQQRLHRHSFRTNNCLDVDFSVIMLSINTASHLLKLSVVVNCSRGVTGIRSEQLAETWTFDYCTTGRSVDFRLLYNWPKRGLSVIVLSINTASHLLKLCVVVNCSRGVTGIRSEQLC